MRDRREEKRTVFTTSSCSHRLVLLLLMITSVVLLLMIATVKVISTNPNNNIVGNHRKLLLQEEENNEQKRQPPLRVLYTITTLAEYDGGDRRTEKGYDRMQYVMIPVIQEGVESMLKAGYHVDVYIVAHYKMTRQDLIRRSLPSQVKLRIWDNASPKTYPPDKRDKSNIKLKDNTLGLARQHRFVIKDNLFDYDMFVNFEDDMIITADHITNHIEITKQLYILRQNAPNTYDPKTSSNFYGNTLTKQQLARIFPGLIRVEVLLDEENYGTQKVLDSVPLTTGNNVSPVDVQPCCHLKNATMPGKRPANPTSDKVFLWETGIRALGVREMPKTTTTGNNNNNDLGWVVFQRGPRTRNDEQYLGIGDYWSGRNKYFGKDRRPQPGEFAYVNNQGGWMATRQQIWEWHTEICLGGFLPPYDSPHYNYDGLDMRNVEYWSGGLNLVTARHACNLQRIVSLDPNKFSKQLIYHSANNKQRQLQSKSKSFVKIDHFYQQLLTVKYNAIEAKEKEN